MAVMVVWHPDVVKRAILDALEANGEIVGKFVEEDARRRLLAIDEPEFGRNYRRMVVSKLLGYKVTRDEKGVTIAVGVSGGPKGRFHGYFIELGSKEHTANPFLRPAVFQNGRAIVKILEGG